MKSAPFPSVHSLSFLSGDRFLSSLPKIGKISLSDSGVFLSLLLGLVVKGPPSDKRPVAKPRSGLSAFRYSVCYAEESRWRLSFCSRRFSTKSVGDFLGPSGRLSLLEEELLGIGGEIGSRRDSYFFFSSAEGSQGERMGEPQRFLRGGLSPQRTCGFPCGGEGR